MAYVLILLSLFGIFGRRRHVAQPPARQAQAGRWYTTPHWADGYWTKTDFSGFVDYLWQNQRHTPNDEAYWKAIYRRRMEQYPFDPWVWDWPGRKDSDVTWHVEIPKDSDKPPERPPQRKWIPDYDPFAPGQKYNL